MNTYHVTPEYSGRRQLGGALALLFTVAIVWMAFTTEDLVNKIGLGLLALIGGGSAIRIGLFLLFMNPTLTISTDGIKVSGYWPASNTNNWAQELRWTEIGGAKKVKKETRIQGTTTKLRTVSLLLYARDDSRKVVGTVADFDKFEKADEITQIISQRLGQQVVEESVQETN